MWPFSLVRVFSTAAPMLPSNNTHVPWPMARLNSNKEKCTEDATVGCTSWPTRAAVKHCRRQSPHLGAHYPTHCLPWTGTHTTLSSDRISIFTPLSRSTYTSQSKRSLPRVKTETYYTVQKSVRWTPCHYRKRADLCLPTVPSVLVSS